MGPREKIRQSAHRLFELYSFLKGDNIDEGFWPRLTLEDHERVLGVYINNNSDYIVVTDCYLHRFHGKRHHVIPYRSLSKVEIPDEETREIIVTLENEQVIPLLIENETEENPDVFEVFDFLCEIRDVFGDRTGEIESVKSQESLVQFYRYGKDATELSQQIADRLENGRASEKHMKKLNIDPSLLERPDVWRLFALLLSSPFQGWDPGDER